MNNRFAKPLALVLSAAVLVAGSVGATVLAMKGSSDKTTAAASKTTSFSEDATKLSKDETVYVLAGADGSVKKIIVSDWIKNSLGSTDVSDKSELNDVKNVKGDETYTMNGDNMRVWDAEGNDIYYQGNISKELPVNLAVSYKLDGKAVSADKLAGRSGKVTIRFDYKNNQYETVSIDGRNETIYVPFAMLTGMLLDNDVFTNVEVTNGKLINDGDRTAVVGIAFPGLQSNLDLSADKLEIPDYVEITADVKNFEMANTVTIATNELFSAIDADKLDSVDGLTSQLDELTDAMNKLMDGSSALYNGLCTLLDKSGELIAGINKLANGLGQLAGNNDALNAGAKQVYDSLLNVAETQLKAAGLTVETLTIDNYSATLDALIKQLSESNVKALAEAQAKEAVTKEVNANKDAVVEGVTKAVRSNVEQQVTAAVRRNVLGQVVAAVPALGGMDADAYNAAVAAGQIPEAVQAQVNAAVDAQMAADNVKALINRNVETQMASDTIKALIEENTEIQIKTLIEENMASETVRSQITAALEKAKAGRESIKSLKTQLDSYNTFYTGMTRYTAGVMEAYQGALTMQQQAPALTDGITRLRDGAMTLSDGLKEFNNKGVQKLVDAVDGELGGLLTRVKATVQVSQDYKSFSGISDEMSGKVRFIYRTDSIKKASK